METSTNKVNMADLEWLTDLLEIYDHIVKVIMEHDNSYEVNYETYDIPGRVMLKEALQGLHKGFIREILYKFPQLELENNMDIRRLPFRDRSKPLHYKLSNT